MTAAIATQPVKEWPTLFSSAMVRALLDGTKSMTRRAVAPSNSLVNGDSPLKRSNGLCGWPDLDFSKAWVDKGPSPAGNPGPYLKVPGGDDSVHRVYPRWQVGDRLWVRETWRTYMDGAGCRGVLFRADDAFVPIANTKFAANRWADTCDNGKHGFKWRPSIFLPRWASRITFEVTSVRVERVQEISEEDAKAEGVQAAPFCKAGRANGLEHVDAFECLWKGINGKREGCSWDANPWVHIIAFKRVNP